MEIFGNVIVPVAALILIVLVILLITRKSGSGTGTHYDEMQLRIRANGYKIGFFVTLAGLFIFSLLTELTDTFGTVLSPSFCMWIAGFAGIVSFTVYCIFKDAFYSIGQNRKGYILLCIFIIILNGFGVIRHISEGTIMEDGSVTFSNAGSLICMISFLIILAALIVKEAFERKEVEE